MVRVGLLQQLVVWKLPISLRKISMFPCLNSRWWTVPVEIGKMRDVMVVFQLLLFCIQTNIPWWNKKTIYMKNKIKSANMNHQNKSLLRVLRPFLSFHKTTQNNFKLLYNLDQSQLHSMLPHLHSSYTQVIMLLMTTMKTVVHNSIMRWPLWDITQMTRIFPTGLWEILGEMTGVTKDMLT